MSVVGMFLFFLLNVASGASLASHVQSKILEEDLFQFPRPSDFPQEDGVASSSSSIDIPRAEVWIPVPASSSIAGRGDRLPFRSFLNRVSPMYDYVCGLLGCGEGSSSRKSGVFAEAETSNASPELFVGLKRWHHDFIATAFDSSSSLDPVGSKNEGASGADCSSSASQVLCTAAVEGEDAVDDRETAAKAARRRSYLLLEHDLAGQDTDNMGLPFLSSAVSPQHWELQSLHSSLYRFYNKKDVRFGTWHDTYVFRGSHTDCQGGKLRVYYPEISEDEHVRELQWVWRPNCATCADSTPTGAPATCAEGAPSAISGIVRAEEYIRGGFRVGLVVLYSNVGGRCSSQEFRKFGIQQL